MKKITKNYKKIIILLLVLVCSFSVLNTVNAAITNVTDEEVCKEQCVEWDEDEECTKTEEICVNEMTGSTTTSATFADTTMTVITKALEYIGNFAGGGTFFALGTTMVALAGLMLIALNALFSVGTGNWVSAMPDSLVFNKVPFLDANFVNPHANSFWNVLKVGNANANVVANLFESIRAVAITIMIIAAMITGLKLALSTIAAKKAQYKEAVMKWVAGFAILVCLKWLIAGIFYINELLVANFAATANGSSFGIPIYLTEAIPFVGKLLTDVTKWISSLWGGDGTLIYAPGFWGIVLSNALRGIGGDIVSAVVTFVIVGQAFVVVGTYFKRLFMCFILGMVSPLIVAVDTITGITGGKSTIFQNWLKNFIFTVFTQSFHAAYMVVAFLMLRSIYTSAVVNYTMQAVITIFILTGLVKLEKMLKGLFGFGDGLSSLSDGQKGFHNALGAIKGIEKAKGALADNKGKADAASKRRAAASDKVTSLESRKKELETNKSNAYQAAKKAKEDGNMAEYYRQRGIFAENSKELKGKSAALGENAGAQSGQQDPVKTAIQNNSRPLTLDEQIAAAKAEEAQAIKDEKAAKFAAFMGPANLAAGIGIGLGGGESIGEALYTGGHITAALDGLAEKSGNVLDSKSVREFSEAKGFKQKAAAVGHTAGRGAHAVFDTTINDFKDVKNAEGFKGKVETIGNKFVEKNMGRSSGSSSSSSSSNGSGSGSSSASPRAQQQQQGTQKVEVTLDVAKLSQDLGRHLRKEMSGMGEDIGRAIRKELSNIDRDLDNE